MYVWKTDLFYVIFLYADSKTRKPQRENLKSLFDNYSLILILHYTRSFTDISHINLNQIITFFVNRNGLLTIIMKRFIDELGLSLYNTSQTESTHRKLQFTTSLQVTFMNHSLTDIPLFLPFQKPLGKSVPAHPLCLAGLSLPNRFWLFACSDTRRPRTWEVWWFCARCVFAVRLKATSCCRSMRRSLNVAASGSLNVASLGARRAKSEAPLVLLQQIATPESLEF